MDNDCVVNHELPIAIDANYLFIALYIVYTISSIYSRRHLFIYLSIYLFIYIFIYVYVCIYFFSRIRRALCTRTYYSRSIESNVIYFRAGSKEET